MDSHIVLNTTQPGEKFDTRKESSNNEHRPVNCIGDPDVNANVLQITSEGALKAEITALPPGGLDVSVSNFPAVQPVSGTFWPGTQPVSGTVGVSNLPALAIPTDRVMQTGTLVTTLTTANQVVQTYTVTAGKTFYLQYLTVQARLTVLSATASIMGTISLESPAGTKLYTLTITNPTVSLILPLSVIFQNLPIAAGTVIRVVCTPAAVTSMTWICNFGGFEK